MRAAILSIAFGCTLIGCGSDRIVPQDVGIDAEMVGSVDVGGGCGGVVTTVAQEPGHHVAVGTPITWSSNPPATGTHYSVWAAFDRSYAQLDRGYWLHDAEHGAVVLLYRCDAGCPEVVDSLVDVARKAPTDSRCTAPVRNKFIVAADPLLPDGVQVAAVAWDVYYTASCFDSNVAAFAAEHYGHGTESTCEDGTPLSGVFIQP